LLLAASSISLRSLDLNGIVKLDSRIALDVLLGGKGRHGQGVGFAIANAELDLAALCGVIGISQKVVQLDRSIVLELRLA